MSTKYPVCKHCKKRHQPVVEAVVVATLACAEAEVACAELELKVLKTQIEHADAATAHAKAKTEYAEHILRANGFVQNAKGEWVRGN